jgi:sugar phosphate isomerase/epimerase
MSVTTEADEKIRKVRELLQEAHNELLVFLNSETWGRDEYNKEYIAEMYEVLSELNKIKNKVD